MFITYRQAAKNSRNLRFTIADIQTSGNLAWVDEINFMCITWTN